MGGMCIEHPWTNASIHSFNNSFLYLIRVRVNSEQVREPPFSFQAKNFISPGRKSERLLPDGRWSRITSTWRGYCVKQMVTQALEHWAFVHLRHGRLAKVAAPCFAHAGNVEQVTSRTAYSSRRTETGLSGSCRAFQLFLRR